MRINAASSPFVNRVVPLTTAGVLVGLAIAFTILNLILFFFFGGEYRRVRRKVSQQEMRISQLNSEIAARKLELESPEVGNFLGEAEFMDEVLRAKSFSWVELLSKLEGVKAYGVMFRAIAPTVEKSGLVLIGLRGVANPREEYLKLENNLFASKNFKNVNTFEESKDQANPWTNFDIKVSYLPDPPGTAAAPLPPLPAQKAPEAGAKPGGENMATAATVAPADSQSQPPPIAKPGNAPPAAAKPVAPAVNQPAATPKPQEDSSKPQPQPRPKVAPARAASPALAPKNRPSRQVPGRGTPPPPDGQQATPPPGGGKPTLESGSQGSSDQMEMRHQKPTTRPTTDKGNTDGAGGEP